MTTVATSTLKVSPVRSAPVVVYSQDTLIPRVSSTPPTGIGSFGPKLIPWVPVNEARPCTPANGRVKEE
jgi:hypothetical protein